MDRFQPGAAAWDRRFAAANQSVRKAHDGAEADLRAKGILRTAINLPLNRSRHLICAMATHFNARA